MSYEYAIRLAAESGKGFDSTNAREIGDHYGEDPKTVLRDIKAARSK